MSILLLMSDLFIYDEFQAEIEEIRAIVVYADHSSSLIGISNL